MRRWLALGILTFLAGSSARAQGPDERRTNIVVYGAGEGNAADGKQHHGRRRQADIVVRAQGESGAVGRRDGKGAAPVVDAGVIPRTALRVELSRGIGRFLQQLRVEAMVLKGRFAGWKVLELRPRIPGRWTDALRPGDVVHRANGRSLEKPGEFARVWDSLRTSSRLVLDIRRDGKPIRLYYRIQ